MAICLLGLGSNLGDCQSVLNSAVSQLENDARIEVAALSEWVETHPVGGVSGQGVFLNGAAVIHTELSPHCLLELTQQIQQQFGRKSDSNSEQRWAARSLDIDLLLYDQQHITSEQLTIPHPRMTFRRFVLEPAAKIAGQMFHAGANQTIENLLAHINAACQYVAICEVGARTAHEVSASTLAALVSQQCGAELLCNESSEILSDHSSPAGKSSNAPIESVLRCAKCLSTARYGADRHLVSDFWLEKLAIEAGQRVVPHDERPHDERELSIVCQNEDIRVVRPKLLVVLDSTSRHTEDDSVARAKLWKLVRRHHRGPILQINAQDKDWAITEITAAFEAMR